MVTLTLYMSTMANIIQVSISIHMSNQYKHSHIDSTLQTPRGDPGV